MAILQWSNNGLFGKKVPFPVPDIGLTEGFGRGPQNPAVLKGGAIGYVPPKNNILGATSGGSAQFEGVAPNVYNSGTRTSGGGVNRTPTDFNPQPTSNNAGIPSGPSQEDLINKAFGSTESFLNDMVREYESQLPEAQKNIESSFERGLTPIAEKEATELGSLNTQEGVVNREEANALAQARQLYNELQQRNVALFGTGSSAGPAANEILGRQTARQFGSIGETATSGRTTIEAERSNVKKFAAQKREDLKLQKEEAIRELQAEFRNNIMRINQQKAANESAKAQARLELLQQAQQQAFQIEQADKAYLRAIDMFEREKASNLAQVGAYQSRQGIDIETANAISSIVEGPGNNASKAARLYTLGLDPKIVGTIVGEFRKEDFWNSQNSTNNTIPGLTPIQE